jgi:hypothetical protein
MFAKKNTTAEAAAKCYQQMIQRNPTLWAEAVTESIKDLQTNDAQLGFLKYMADPSGKTGIIDMDIPTAPLRDEIPFADTSRFQITEVLDGKIPVVRLKYINPSAQDDEKIEE